VIFVSITCNRSGEQHPDRHLVDADLATDASEGYK